MRLSDLQKRVIASVKEETRFIATFDTTLTSVGSSASNQIALPLLSSGGTYNFNVEWGDGSSDVITSGTQLERTHTYASSGVYDIKISGLCRGFRFANTGDRLKILDIKNWGISVEYLNNTNVNLGDFFGCANMDFTAQDVPVLLGSVAAFFRGCSSLVGNPSINKWNVGNVTNFSNMFQNASSFNQDIGAWNVGNSTNFARMFASAFSFNQDIGAWNVSNGTDFALMFQSASSFNQDIGAWNVGNSTNFAQMFQFASSFNQNIGAWNVGNSTNFAQMFQSAISFNQDIGAWNVANGTNFGLMFVGATSFNQDIGAWNVSNGTDFALMFQSASSFNQDIGAWNVGNVTNFSNMFQSASLFNQDIGAWNVGNGTNLNAMFNLANSFAKSIGDWNLNASATMTNMLNVSNATIGTNLQEWYSRTLIGWANDVFARGGVPSGRSLGANNRRYNNTAYTTGLQFNDAVSARDYLVNTAGWTISGDAQI
jgi:surface protein